MDVLGATPDSDFSPLCERARAQIAYELVSQDKSEPSLSTSSSSCGGRRPLSLEWAQELRRRLSNTAATFPHDERCDVRRSKLMTFDASLNNFIGTIHIFLIYQTRVEEKCNVF